MESSVSEYLLSEYDKRAWHPGAAATYRRGLASIKTLYGGCTSCCYPDNNYEHYGDKDTWTARLSADFCEQCWLQHNRWIKFDGCTHG